MVDKSFFNMLYINLLLALLLTVSDTLNAVVSMDSTFEKTQNKNYDSIQPKIDSLYYAFENDTVTLSQPTNVSQIVYVEHEESPNAFYGIIFPIITLILGVAIDRSAQVLIDKRKMKKNGKRWKNELESCVLPIQKQIQALSSFINDFCDNSQRYDIPDILVYPILEGKTFASLNKEDLQDYLECKKDSQINVQERFYKITTFVMSMEMIYKSFMEAYNSFKQSAGQQVDMFNLTQLNYSQLLLATASKVPERMTEDAYIRLDELFQHAFSALPNVNLFELENTFINASLLVLNRYDHLEFKELNDRLIDMRHCISGLKLEKTYLKTNLLGVVEQYNLCLKALENIREFFPKK